jgi:hypothetical protein
VVEQWAEFLLNPFLGESERLAIPQLTEWQGIGNQIDAASICQLPSARGMQDSVRLAFLHFLQQLTGFQCGRRNDFDTAPFRLR